MSENKKLFVALLLVGAIGAVMLSDKVSTEAKLILICVMIYGLFWLMTYLTDEFAKIIERGKFGDIVCTGLKVVRDDGTEAVTLSTYLDESGVVYIHSREANRRDERFAHDPDASRVVMVRIGGDGDGGNISLNGKDGKCLRLHAEWTGEAFSEENIDAAP